ncbi:DUF4258 domain-containing protein [Chloroflexi bacterium TSY]|nr:DUF4258 domain-containing protein [Chloroflexi bacterium TSY]
MEIETIRQKVRNGDYLVRNHAVLHALKEGFVQQDMVNAILNGQIIEAYPDDKRVLVCGHTDLDEHVKIYLHVVCEHADPDYIEFVTAYIPDEKLWERPDFRRRKRRGR